MSFRLSLMNRGEAQAELRRLQAWLGGSTRQLEDPSTDWRWRFSGLVLESAAHGRALRVLVDVAHRAAMPFHAIALAVPTAYWPSDVELARLAARPEVGTGYWRPVDVAAFAAVAGVVWTSRRCYLPATGYQVFCRDNVLLAQAQATATRFDAVVAKRVVDLLKALSRVPWQPDQHEDQLRRREESRGQFLVAPLALFFLLPLLAALITTC